MVFPHLKNCLKTNCVLTCNGWARHPQAEGNAYFGYQHNNILPNAMVSTLTISDTVINGGADTEIMSSRGIIIAVRNFIVQYQLSITLINCSFHNNDGGNMRMALFGTMPLLSLTLHIVNTTFRNGRSQTIGGGLSLTSTIASVKSLDVHLCRTIILSYGSSY